VQKPFTKQVTAAGFQLKGSGWYVTDFRGGNAASSAPATEAKSDGQGAAGTQAAPAADAASVAPKAAPSTAPAAAGASASSSD
jgi:hypothetical protein